MYDNCKENMSVGNVSESVGKLETIAWRKNPIMTFTVVKSIIYLMLVFSCDPAFI